MANNIRVGVIGVGWGSSVHVPAFRSVPGYEVVALCGRSARVADIGAKAGVTDTSTDWESFVRRADLDLIAITTPPSQHRAMSLAAIAAGKHVLCEKPMALNATEAAEMTAAADKAGVVAAIGHEWRWQAERLALAGVVRAGGLGAMTTVSMNHQLSMWHPALPAPAVWKYSAAEGGGFINAVLCHEIEFARLLWGEPVAVLANLTTLAPSRTLPDGTTVTVDADDTNLIHLRMAGGGLVTINGSALCLQGSGVRVEAYGDQGSVGFRNGPEGMRAFVATAGGKQEELPVPIPETAPLAVPAGYGMTGAVRATALMLADLLPRFTGGSTTVASFHDGLRVQQLVDAARQSSREGRWVEV